MWAYAKLGWKTARGSWFLLFILFLYQYVWGFALYKYVKATVVPLLHRYPGEELPESASRLFWLEAEFQLTKTDLVVPFLWTFGLLYLLRLLLTPLINCGVYGALSAGGGHRKAFFASVRRHAKPFLLLYALQSLLAFGPLVWLLPRAIDAAATAYDGSTLAIALLPYIAGWLAYQGLLDLAFMHAGFAIVQGERGWTALPVLARNALPIVGLSLATFAIAAAVGLAVAALSLWWAGFIAVLLHQTYPFVRSLMKLWAIAAQLHLRTACK